MCPKCGAAYTHFQAGELMDPYRGTLVCTIAGCGAEVVDNETQAEAQSSKDRMERLINQTTPIRVLLKNMDDFTLPKWVPSPRRRPG